MNRINRASFKVPKAPQNRKISCEGLCESLAIILETAARRAQNNRFITIFARGNAPGLPSNTKCNVKSKPFGVCREREHLQQIALLLLRLYYIRRLQFVPFVLFTAGKQQKRQDDTQTTEYTVGVSDAKRGNCKRKTNRHSLETC